MIIHFSTYDFGGAGNAAYKFHKQLLAGGYDSLLFVKRKTRDDETVIAMGSNFENDFVNSLSKLIKSGIDNKYAFLDLGFGSLHNACYFKDNLARVDAIMLHWVSGFVNYDVIYELKKSFNCKVFWTLMDKGPLTGGCHAFWSCKEYINGCLSCPAIMDKKLLSLPNLNALQKKEFVNKCKVIPITGSSIHATECESSFIFQGRKVLRIMAMLDSSTFKPADSINDIINIKNILNIDINKRVFLIMASDLMDGRKGIIDYLLKSIVFLNEKVDSIFENSVFFIVGNNSNKIADYLNSLNINAVSIGYLHSEQDLAKIFQVSDFFLSASVEDAGPMTVYLSILSGVPVVAFNIGIAPDLVLPLTTGFIVEEKNAFAYAQAIYQAVQLSSENVLKLKRNCRILGLNKTSLSTNMNSFILALTDDSF